MNTNPQKSQKTKIKILFVCLGNICRSPAAEGIMRHLVEVEGCSHRIVVDSAGIGSWHVGQLPDYRMRRHGARHGYDFNSRARQFSVEDFLKFDYIVGMDEENMRDIQRKARNNSDKSKIICMADYLSRHPHHHEIPDPYYGSDKDFELVIDLLEDACEQLFIALSNF